MALLKFKRSAVPAKIPSIADLDLGELAINTYDGKVYTKKDDGTQAIVEVGGGGGVQTITSSDGSVTVTGTTDINLSVPVTAATNTVILPVRNNTGATLAKGTAVYINGALGQNPTVTKAIATGDATSAQTLGLVTADINNNSVGNVTLIGTLTNVDTSAFSDGQQLYLSPTTAGALTATKPYAPSHLVYMAVVEHAHPALGKLFVKVQNGYEMDELHDVSARNPANNDGLFYNTTTSLWEKKSIATALGYTPANKAGDTFNGVVSIYSSNDAQLYLNGNGTSWAGMSWADVSGSDFIWYNGSTSTFAIGGGGSFVANKKLHVHGGMTIGSGLAMSASGTNSLSVEGNVTSNVDVRAPIFYDSNDTAYYVDPNSTTNLNVIYGNDTYSRAWFRNINSNEGIYNQATGQHWYSDSGSYWNMGGGNINGQGIRFRDTHNGTVRGYVYYDQSNNVGFLNNEGSWRARVVGGDYFLVEGSSARAQIFYDSNDTAYYINGAGDSVLNTLYFRNGSIQAKFAQASNFGYSSSYRTVVLGNEYLTTISMGVDVSGNASGSFNGQGEGREVLFRNGVTFVTPNSANTGYLPTFNMTDGYVTSGGSVRSPIFYDSDNTGYYVDPASTSVLGGIVLNGALDVRDSNPQYWRSTNGAYQRVDTRTEATSLSRAHWYGVDSSGGTSNFRHAWYDGSQYFNVSAGSGQVSFERLGGGGSVYSAGDFRAPIFYDSNNTGYYVDPASTSNLVGLTVANTITGSITGTAAKATDLNQARYVNNDFNTLGTSPQVFRAYTNYIPSGGSYNQPPNGAGDYKVLQWGDVEGGTSGNWGGQIVQNFYDDRMWFRRSYGTTWQAWREFIHDGNYTSYAMPIGSSATNSVDVRAPIFYDSNNTGFYVDGNATSNLSRLSVAGRSMAGSATLDMSGLDQNTWYPVTIPIASARQTRLRIENALNSNAPSWSTHPSGFSCYVEWTSNGAGWGTIGVNRRVVDWRESFTTVQIVGGIDQLTQSSTEVIWLRGGGNYFFSADNDVNPTIRTSTYEINGQSVSPRTTTYNTPWTASTGQTGAAIFYATSTITSATDVRAPIFYDSNDTSYYVDANSTSVLNGINVWGEIGARRNDVQSILRSYNLSAGGPQQFYLDHNYGNVNIGNSRGVVYAGGSYWEIANSVRAPIFYDSNNTGYYVDPASASVLNEIQTFGVTNIYDVSTNHEFGLFFSAGKSTAYAIYREAGAWSHPFPDLRIAFHTGIKMGAAAGYGGMKFYTDYDMVSQVMSVNNSSDGLGAGHVFINNALQVNGDIRTPVFYDANDTTYYLNPNSTGTSLNVAGSIVAAGNVTAYSDIRIKANVETIPSALDKLDQIRGVTYTRTDLDNKEQRYAGVIAQEIEAVLPEAVRDLGNIKAVDYNATIALLIQAVKELRDEVEALRK